MVLPVVVIALTAYLLGSIPTGYLAGRLRGLDLRTVGSGNIGATNALRVLGKPMGIGVLVIDALKGLLATTVVPTLVIRTLGSPGASSTAVVPSSLLALAGMGAVLGHTFTCWLRFKGGKGVATSAGALLGLMPWTLVTILAVFLLVVGVTRIVSLGSILAALALPPVSWFWHRDPLLLGFGFVLAALVIWRHRGNIARLRAGTEPRLGRKPPPPSSAPAA